jgi:hypothetical protein
MSFKFKAVVAAIGLSLGLAAQAAQINGDGIPSPGIATGTGAGNLVLSVFDVAGQRALIYNLNTTVNDFGTGVNNLSYSDAGLNSFLSSISTANLGGVIWNVTAISNQVDQSGPTPVWTKFGFYTTAAPGQILTGGPSGNGPPTIDAISNTLASVGDYYLSNNTLNGGNGPLNTGNTAVTTPADGLAYGNTLSFGNNMGNAGNFNNTGNLGDALTFYLWHGINDGQSFGDTATDLLPGRWQLQFNGAQASLTYQAVPVPAALWLLGSALAGMVSISRRKTAANR